MFSVRRFLVLFLALSFLVMPAEKAEAGPILRAVGATLGVAAGLAVGAAVLTRNVVARTVVGAYRFGRWLLFGHRWNRYCSYGCASNQVSYSNAHDSGNYAASRPEEQATDLESWCWNQFRPQDDGRYSPAICSVSWRGMKMWGQGNNATYAYARTQVEMCKVGMNVDTIKQMASQIACKNVGGQDF